MPDGSLHAHHRKRMMEKFQKYGMDVFTDVEALEMALYLSIPRGNTNDIAHRLINTFGSLHAVFEATEEALRQVEGIGPVSALNLRFLRELFSRYRADSVKVELHGCALTTEEKMAAYFVPQFEGYTVERMLAAYLDGKGRVLRCEEIGRGSITQVRADLRLLMTNAVNVHAAGVALAHNHPDGQLVISKEDISVTIQIEDLLRSVQVSLVDHLVVQGDRYISVCSKMRINGGKGLH